MAFNTADLSNFPTRRQKKMHVSTHIHTEDILVTKNQIVK